MEKEHPPQHRSNSIFMNLTFLGVVSVVKLAVFDPCIYVYMYIFHFTMLTIPKIIAYRVKIYGKSISKSLQASHFLMRMPIQLLVASCKVAQQDFATLLPIGKCIQVG